MGRGQPAGYAPVRQRHRAAGRHGQLKPFLRLPWAGVALQPCGMSRPVPGSPHVALLLGWLPPGGGEDPHRDRSLKATRGPSGLLPRRRLQPALRVRGFCREHAQLFRWIYTGLLCTGEPSSSRDTPAPAPPTPPPMSPPSTPAIHVSGQGHQN